MKKLLLINPPIYDFSAMDMWAAPYGLMVIASALRRHAVPFEYIDFLGREYIEKEYPDGRRKYSKMVIDKPEILRDKGINRRYAVYGAAPEEVWARLSSLGEAPDGVIITTGMTYWYPACDMVYGAVKKLFPKTEVFAGGVYASILPGHAKKLMPGAKVFTNSELSAFDRVLTEFLGTTFKCFDRPFEMWDYPGLNYLNGRGFIPLLLTKGCPFGCTYCAVDKLSPEIEHRDVLGFYSWVITASREYGIKDLVLYDDAFLFRAGKYAQRFLKTLIAAGDEINIHAVNGLHARWIDEEIAGLMKQSGFKTIRLSLETINEDIQKKTGNKVKTEEFLKAFKNLIHAGFEPADIGVYLMAGLPDQTPEDLHNSIKFVKETGAGAYIAEFSPIPGTACFEEAGKISREDLTEPLWQNNTLFQYWHPEFPESVLQALKDEAIKTRRADNEKQGGAN
ncbi:MAG TPA: radical SAM protein [bacterium]